MIAPDCPWKPKERARVRTLILLNGRMTVRLLVGLELKIDVDFLAVVEAFDKIKANDIIQATRRAINRTLAGVRQDSLDQLRKKLALKESVLRKRFIKLTKASGNSISSLAGFLDFSNEPIPLLEFVRGSKENIQQKGIPVKKRRKLKAEITPGKRFVVRKAFIQRKFSKQVFKRDSSGGFKKQGTRSVGFMLQHRGIGERIVAKGNVRFQKELLRELKVRIEGTVKSADAQAAGRMRQDGR